MPCSFGLPHIFVTFAARWAPSKTQPPSALPVFNYGRWAPLVASVLPRFSQQNTHRTDDRSVGLLPEHCLIWSLPELCEILQPHWLLIHGRKENSQTAGQAYNKKVFAFGGPRRCDLAHLFKIRFYGNPLKFEIRAARYKSHSLLWRLVSWAVLLGEVTKKSIYLLEIELSGEERVEKRHVLSESY